MLQLRTITATKSSLRRATSERNRIVFISNSTDGLYLFRRQAINSLIHHGYHVTLISPFDHRAEDFIAYGADISPIELHRQSTNPFRDIGTVFEIYRLLKSLRPNLVFTYTLKPNIYGCLAADRLGMPVISVVAGLGALPSLKNTLLQRIIYSGYRTAIARATEVWFLNAHDQGFFEGRGWLKHTLSRLLPGEGLSASDYSWQPLPTNERPQILFLGRLLLAKGVRIFAKAAQLAKDQSLDLDFVIYGPFDDSNPDGVSVAELHEWTTAGILRYKGVTDEVAHCITASDIVAVPTSYHEGLNRVIQEALAVGRSVITTAMPGAGELVQHQETGYIIPSHDPAALLEAIQYHLSLSQAKREQMSRLGSRLTRQRYDVRLVLEHYWDAIDRYVHKP